MPQFIKRKGFVDYEEISAEMQEKAARIHMNQYPEEIIFLEHPPLITAGSSAKHSDLQKQPPFPVYQSPRGGQYTYHGPGQLIIYVLLNLESYEKDIRKYIEALELWGIRSLQHFGIQAAIRHDRVGLWVKNTPNSQYSESKIAAIGVRLKKWVTTHGMSINIHVNLDDYQYITPCGIREFGVTDMQSILHEKAPDLDSVVRIMQSCFHEIPFFNTPQK